MRPFRLPDRWSPTLLLLLTLAALAGAPAAAQSDQVAALREGNRLFREDRIEEAFDAYQAGYDAAAPHPVLSYNLGTAAHRLDRLPEAILWYRRAAAVNPGDPWLRENLESARATLGLQPYPAPGIASAISRNAQWLYLLAALIAWGGAGLWLARSRAPLRPVVTLLVVALVVYGVAWIAGRSTPRAAVVLSECTGRDGDLPAGSEVWIASHNDGTVEIAAGGLQIACPAEAVRPVTSWE